MRKFWMTIITVGFIGFIAIGIYGQVKADALHEDLPSVPRQEYIDEKDADTFDERYGNHHKRHHSQHLNRCHRQHRGHMNHH